MNEQQPAIEAFREDQRLHPMTLLQRLIVSLPGLVLLVLTASGGRDPAAWVYILLLGLYGFVAVPLMVLQYLRFRFRITNQELQIDSGVLTRRRRSIPIERIQNVEIQRPLIARFSGTAKVRVETAGSAGAEGILELVSLETAHALRDAVRAYQRELSLETPDEARDLPSERQEPAPLRADEPVVSRAAKEELYSMPLRRVLLSGVFRFSLVYIVLMFSGLEYLNVDAVDIFDWIERGPLHPFAEFAAESPFVAVMASLTAAALIAWITGILVNLNRFYRFRLRLAHEKLQNQQGLLTLHEGAIPLKRIQAYILRTNPLMRHFGWWAMDVQTLGLESSRRGRSVIVPFARWEETLSILGRLEPAVVPDQFERVSPLTIRRRFFRYSAVLLVAVGVVSLQWSGVAWALTGIPLLLLVAILQYRNHGYFMTEDHLLVRSGVIRHHVWIIPTRKDQAFFATESIFQRRLGLGTLEVDAAGAPSWGAPRIVDLPSERCAVYFDDLAARFRRAWNRGRTPVLSST